MQIDEEFLESVGLGEMPENQKKAFLEYAQEELEVRVGEKISEGMSEEKMNEFDEIEDQELALKWLEENRPDFRDVVAKVVEDFKKELSSSKEQILA